MTALPPEPEAGPSAELADGTQPDAGTRIETAVADYTESVVPASARRSNFRMLLTFGSMQLVFGAVLVGYDARFEARLSTVTADLLIRAARAVTGDGLAAERPLALAVTSGRIAAMEPLDGTRLTGRDVLDLGADVVLMPGLVDSHVHVCEPGNTDWEGFATATRAAAAGGITTLVDMPLDSVPTTVDVAAAETQADRPRRASATSTSPSGAG